MMRTAISLILLFGAIGFAQNTGEIIRLDSINSNSDEVAPLLSSDGKTMFFARLNYSGNHYGEDNSQDVWMSKRQDNGSWGSPIRVEAEFNNARSKALVWGSDDGTKFYVTGRYSKNGKWIGRGLSAVLRLDDNRWSIPEEVKIKGLKRINKGRSCNIHVSETEDVMLLSFTKKWDKVPNKLYVSRKKKQGWGKPKRLKKPFTNFKTVDAPYFDSQDSVIYFSGRSKRFDCANQADLFKVKVLDSKFKKFGNSERLVGEVNSDNYDSYFMPLGNGDSYLVSDRGEGGSDIYFIKNTEVRKPDQEEESRQFVEFSGFIRDELSGTGIEGDSVISMLLDGVGVDSVAYSEENGYSMKLPFGRSYVISAKVKGYVIKDTTIDLSDVNDYDKRKLDLYAKEQEVVEVTDFDQNERKVGLEADAIQTVDKDHFERLTGSDFRVGQVFSLNHIYFVLSKVDLLPESEPELNTLVTLLSENPNVRIQIEGHTDYGGVESQNLTLSEARAESVGEYLISHGISSKRIEYKGFGSTRRLVKSQVKEERIKNRRVEFRIIEILVPKEKKK